MVGHSSFQHFHVGALGAFLVACVEEDKVWIKSTTGWVQAENHLNVRVYLHGLDLFRVQYPWVICLSEICGITMLSNHIGSIFLWEQLLLLILDYFRMISVRNEVVNRGYGVLGIGWGELRWMLWPVARFMSGLRGHPCSQPPSWVRNLYWWGSRQRPCQPMVCVSLGRPQGEQILGHVPTMRFSGI